MLRRDEAAVAENGRPLQDVSELTDIARPMVIEQGFARLPRNARWRSTDRPADLLNEGEAACHAFIVGELACGNLHNRDEILSLLQALPSVPKVQDDEVLVFIGRHKLMGRGLGLIDVHLLASCALAGVGLWTLDRRLRAVAEALRLAAR